MSRAKIIVEVTEKERGIRIDCEEGVEAPREKLKMGRNPVWVEDKEEKSGRVKEWEVEERKVGRRKGREGKRKRKEKKGQKEQKDPSPQHTHMHMYTNASIFDVVSKIK